MTDSTASLPSEICQALDIEVVPLTVHFGAHTFMDGVDPVDEFYNQLERNPNPPTTSTPSPGAFLAVYQRLLQEADGIISIHLMGTKSGTVCAAQVAAGMLPPGKVHVVDSQSVTLGLGLLAMAAAKMAQVGENVAAILARLEQAIPQTHIHAAIREMTQLRRSGRVPLAQALVANLLAIKPVVYGGHNIIEVVDKARGWPQAVERMIEKAKAAAGDARVALAVLHTANKQEALELMERVREQFNHIQAMVTEAGPSLATHVGKGGLAIVTMPALEA